MILDTQRTLIQRVAARWRRSYRHEKVGSEKFNIGLLLAELDGNTATSADVEAIIGNGYWTKPNDCDECNARDGRPVVQLGQEPDYDSNTVWICLDCLKRAVALAEAG